MERHKFKSTGIFEYILNALHYKTCPPEIFMTSKLDFGEEMFLITRKTPKQQHHAKPCTIKTM